MSRPRATSGIGYRLQNAILQLLAGLDEGEDIGSTQIADTITQQCDVQRGQVIAALRQLCLDRRVYRRGPPPHHCRYSLNEATTLDEQPRADAGCARAYVAPALIGGPLVWSLGLQPARPAPERQRA